MKKQNFFATDFGRQTLAFLLILLSFPVICCGFRFSLEALVYLGMGLMISHSRVFTFSHAEAMTSRFFTKYSTPE